jgi:hypothetical protein
MAANEAATIETVKAYRDIIARPGGAPTDMPSAKFKSAINSNNGR